eukprot:3484346-Pyramimonas_sp.AAC.1
MAIIAPAFAVRVHVQTHSDCLGVFWLHNQSSAQALTGRSKPAGLRRVFYELEGAEFVGQAHHAPAHISSEVIDSLPPAERRIARANDMAVAVAVA